MANTWKARSQGPKFKFPLNDEADYSGRIVFEAFQEAYTTLAGTQWDSRRYEHANEFAGLEGLYGNQPTQRTATNNIGERSPKGSIQLYLPNALKFGDAAEYTNVDLGLVGGAISSGIRDLQSGAQLAQSFLAASIPDFESMADLFTQGITSEGAQVAALRLAKVNSGALGAVETETGVTLNPNRRSTFKGIGVRRFRFSFILIPTSAAEAQQIKNIVGFFRLQMYPELKGNLGAPGISAAMQFPHKFNIRMKYGDKRIGTSILPCFLENVETTYNPNSMAFHSDGEPQETQISLSFVEERALTKEDIIKDLREAELLDLLEPTR